MAETATAGYRRERSALAAVERVAPELGHHLHDRLAEVERRLHEIVAADDAFLTQAATYLINAGGKRMRPLIVLLGADFGDPEAPGVVTAAAMVELIHVASLYHDDVMDDAPLRHGVRSANVRWGNSVAVLLGDYLLAKAAGTGASLGQAAIDLQVETIDRLVRGQVRETTGPGPGADPAAHALSVMADKSGALITMSAKLGALVAGAPAAYVAALGRAAENLGVAFQLADDLLDITGAPGDSGKTPGTDLREGVLTLPVRYAIAERGRAARQLRRIVTHGPVDDPSRLAVALDLLRASPALPRTRTAIASYTAAAREEIAELPNIPARHVLASLCDFAAHRDH
ncbi:MAG TPA: polyprenyl synthetase family protein [Streptosporangiaceae bacterium]|jgi:heptaprenyl diphosphate synthase